MSDRLAAAISELVDAIREEVGADTAPTPSRLLSVDEASDALGIGRTALYGAIASGRVRSVSVGRRRLIPSTVIEELAAGPPGASK